MAFRRRCLLFVPGDSERKIAHALRLPVDGLVFDLEDAVAPGAKAAARRTVSAALPAVPPGCERVVRVNAVATGLATEDVRGTMAGRPDAYMLPKVRDPTEIVAVARAIAEAEAAHGLPAGQVRLVVIGTETAAGVLAIRELARAHPRVNGLLWGSEDLSADIGARRTHGPDGRLLDVFAHARSVALLAAAAARIDAFDMPYLRIGDTAGLRREAEESAAMGFVGKLAIHPEQIAPIVEAFTPAGEEVDAAHAMLAAWEAAGRPGTFAHAGEMVDAPMLARARRIVGGMHATGRGT
ncbi:MAG TPA: CoA ester lyase [Candidatus Binatia bacterium]|jgi:citrate lyase subunit beta/citryl-CoA lyase|nr:CoA ester lyase [Candidatus Binatia bacterium]